MRFIKPLGILAAITMMICVFLPWIQLESRGVVVTGMDAGITRYGKPGMLHLIFTAIFLVLLAIPQVWSRRLNMLFVAFNMAWAARNYLLISACYAGECPEKQAALYLLPLSAAVMLLVVLFAPERQRS